MNEEKQFRIRDILYICGILYLIFMMRIYPDKCFENILYKYGQGVFNNSLYINYYGHIIDRVAVVLCIIFIIFMFCKVCIDEYANEENSISLRMRKLIIKVCFGISILISICMFYNTILDLKQVRIKDYERFEAYGRELLVYKKHERKSFFDSYYLQYDGDIYKLNKTQYIQLTKVKDSNVYEIKYLNHSNLFLTFEKLYGD